MLRRYNEYTTLTKEIRCQFSEVQKREIAQKQNYKCPGSLCNGEKTLPSTWVLEHIRPLFQFINENPTMSIMDLTTIANDTNSNIKIYCSTCSSLKTQKERVDFYANERKHKLNDLQKFIPAFEYYREKEQPVEETVVTDFPILKNMTMKLDSTQNPICVNDWFEQFIYRS